MKGSVIVLFVVVIAAVVLFYSGGYVASKASENPDFVAMYNASKAARTRQPIYAPPAKSPRLPGQAALSAAPAEAATAPNAAASISDAPEPPAVAPAAADVTDESILPADAAPGVFAYPPYMAVFLIPLSFAKTIETAALAWYVTNILLFLIAMFLSLYTVAGRFATGEKGLFLVPLIPAVPLIAFFLPTQSAVLLALVFILIGLCLFRHELDVLGGLFSSLALFSPLGVIFAVYYAAKRSWLALAGYLAGALVLFVVLPVVYFGPQEGWKQTEGYRAKVLAPIPAEMLSSDSLRSADNQSVWAMLERNLSEIGSLGQDAGLTPDAMAKVPAQVRRNWRVIVFVALGVLLGFATIVGIWRRLSDRNMAIVGLEGALLILATLLLNPSTSMASLVVLVLPLFAVVYVIRVTDIRRLVHHVNYIGIVAATAAFYLAFDVKFRGYGIAFAGTFILWVAVIIAINRFRPHLVRGHVSAVSYGGEYRREDRSGKVKTHEPAFIDSPAEKSREGIMPLPDFTRPRQQHFEGTAGVTIEPKAKDMPPIELHEGDEDEKKDEKEHKGPGSVSLE